MPLLAGSGTPCRGHPAISLSRSRVKAHACRENGGRDAGSPGSALAARLHRASLPADLPRLGKGPAMSSSTLAHMATNDLDAFFMPFPSNRQYQKEIGSAAGRERVCQDV